MLWDLDRADSGTRIVTQALAEQALKQVHLWGTSAVPFEGLDTIDPPPWNAAAAQAAVALLLLSASTVQAADPPPTPREGVPRAVTPLSAGGGQG